MYFSGVNFREKKIFVKISLQIVKNKCKRCKNYTPQNFFAPWYLHRVLTTILKGYTTAGRLYVEATTLAPDPPVPPPRFPGVQLNSLPSYRRALLSERLEQARKR